jgi:hypothetical protein
MSNVLLCVIVTEIKELECSTPHRLNVGHWDRVQSGSRIHSNSLSFRTPAARLLGCKSDIDCREMINNNKLHY